MLRQLRLLRRLLRLLCMLLRLWVLRMLRLRCRPLHAPLLLRLLNFLWLPRLRRPLLAQLRLWQPLPLCQRLPIGRQGGAAMGGR
jgi:hypothetical protein